MEPMTGNVINVTENNFEEIVRGSDMPVLLDFWAPWCGPCLALNPTIDRLAREFQGQVKIAKIQTDENVALADRYGVRSIPQLMIQVHSKAEPQRISARSFEALSKLLSHYVGGNDPQSALSENLEDPELRITYFETADLADIAEILKKHPNYVNADFGENYDGATPATYFLLTEDLERFELFREYGARLSLLDMVVAGLNEALADAAKRNPADLIAQLRGPLAAETFEALFDARQDLATLNDNKLVPTDLANANRHLFYRAVISKIQDQPDLAVWLRDHGLDFSVPTNDGLIAYHYACVMNADRAKAWLLENRFGLQDINPNG